MLASLPMYDWNGVQEATDALWVAIRDRFRKAGIEAPDDLTRPFAEEQWIWPELVLSQTCGMPYRLSLHRHVVVLGTADYGVGDCPPGYYRSMIVARRGERAEGVAAVNALNSQSGWAALCATMGLPDEKLMTGSHSRSIVAVANGKADYAAIDAVSWQHALREMPEAQELDVVQATRPSPGLPFICAFGLYVPAMPGLLAAAIEGLEARHKASLFLRGFVPLNSASYLF
jgi:hypothetical protein